MANGKGVSTFSSPDPLWLNVWRLPAGTGYSQSLVVWNDVFNHWVWEPVKDMPLTDYVGALADVERKFVRNS